jgi:hypothetical protein
VPPFQALPVQTASDQLTPFQALPVHSLPFQAEPVQASPLQRSRTQREPFQGWQRTSISPRISTGPPAHVATTRPAPRLASIEPRPLADRVWTAVGVGAVTAASSCSRPAPWAKRVWFGMGAAVEVSSSLTWSGVSVGRAARSRAAAPDATAAACEVPEPRM